MNIAVIEYESDLEAALNDPSFRDGIFLSVSAEASYHLAKNGMRFMTDEDVLSPDEFKAIGNENFDIVEKWIAALEGALRGHDAAYGEKGFFPFRWNFYSIKILLDTVRTRSAILNRLIEAGSPSYIGSPPAASPGAISNHDLFFYRDESLYGLLVGLIAKDKNIRITTWPKYHAEMFLASCMERASVFARRAGKAFKKVVFESKPLKDVKHNMLIGNLHYDIEPLMRRLSDVCSFYFYQDPSRVVSLQSFLKLTANEPADFPRPHIDNGIFSMDKITGDPCLDEILNTRMQSYAEKFIPLLWHGFNYLDSIDKKKNFSAYIHHAGASDSFYSLPIGYFETKNKPVIIVQHGGYGFALNQMAEYSEFGHNGYFLAWGDGIKEMYECRKKGKCEFMTTGSHLIEEIKKSRRPRKTISKVCFIPTTNRGYPAYYPNGQPCLDSKAFLLETEFLNTLKPYAKRYEITYKAAPGSDKISTLFGKNPMFDWIKENLPSVKIESRPLDAVIHDFDLVIIMWPSTTLVQAMASGAEILVYAGNPYFSLTGQALKMLGKRAIAGLTKDDFKDKIRMVLDKGSIVSDVNDEAFLERYGVYRNDGKSLSRMAEQVLALC